MLTPAFLENIKHAIDSDDNSGITSEFESFVEEFSAEALGEKVVGIGRKSRASLDGIIASESTDERTAGLVVATIELARQLSALSYNDDDVDFHDELHLWVETLVEWLQHNEPDSPAHVAAKSLFATL